MNYCGNCGKGLNDEKYICSKCGNFIDNDVIYDIDFLNNYREQILRRKKLLLYKTILVCIAINLFFFFVSIESLSFTVLVSFLSFFFIPSIFTKKDVKRFSLLYKKIIVQSVIMECYDNVVYKPEIGFSKERLDKTNMLNIGYIFDKNSNTETYQYHDRFIGIDYSSSDYIKATYKNISFEQADLHITKTVSDHDGDSVVDIFNGQWLIFKFDKPFIADFQVYYHDLSIVTTGNVFRKNKLQKVELEDQKFNDIYDVYAENPVNVFYILTPPIIEKLKTIRSLIRGRLIVCFVNNEVHIGLYNYKNLFEHNIKYKVELDETSNSIKKDLNVIMSFIDLLIVNENLFRKG